MGVEKRKGGSGNETGDVYRHGVQLPEEENEVCKFQHLLEEHGLNKLFFEAINRVMVETGHMLKGGTIVDATIINAPSSTKNAQKARDPEMHQTKRATSGGSG